jgi:hypothetical protein
MDNQETGNHKERAYDRLVELFKRHGFSLSDIPATVETIIEERDGAHARLRSAGLS